jgi:hypothetical protein
MRYLWCAACVLAVGLGSAGSLRAGDDKESRELVARAVKALGGQEKLDKYAAVTIKGSGTYYGQGDGLAISGEWSIQFPDKQYVRIEVKVGDATFTRTIVLNGDKGWTKELNAKTAAMSKKQLDEEREQLYANWVDSLAPLKDKAYKLSPVGEVQVNGKKAVGVRVSREGHRDVSVFFDAETWLPVKSETVVRDLEGGADKEVTQETYYSNYKEIDGVQQAMKIRIDRDGKRFVEAEWSEVRLAERLDDSVFARPD